MEKPREGIAIKNGMILDGTGNPPVKGDILIKGDTISAIAAKLPARKIERAEILDANGLMISPGFIDMHSHSDLTILHDPCNPEKILQGVTTEVVGNCGIGIAPSTTEIMALLNQLAKDIMKGKTGTPFPSIRSFQDSLDALGHSTNLIPLVPHGNLRAFVMGMTADAPSGAEMEAMKKKLDEEMESGAWGISTGLIYPPGSTTKTPELVEICKVISRHNGIYASHIRDEGSGIMDAIDEIITIGTESKVHVHVSHLKVIFKNKLTSKVLNRIEAERAADLAITADMYPYIAGSANLGSIMLPTWVFKKGGSSLAKIIEDPSNRKRIISGIIDNLFKFAKINPKLRKILPRRLIEFALKQVAKKVMVTHAANSPGTVGRFLVDIMKHESWLKGERGIFNKILKFLARENGNITVCIFQEDEEKTLIPILERNFTMIGTDGIAGHPRSWGTYPRVLHRYVREKGVLSLENAIYKMTGLVATTLDLKDRGFLKPGYKADIVVFNPDTIKDNATYDSWDLPPDGIEHIMVNGVITATKGKHLGGRHGRVIGKSR